MRSKRAAAAAATFAARSESSDMQAIFDFLEALFAHYDSVIRLPFDQAFFALEL